MSDTVPPVVTEEKKEEESILDKVTSAFSTVTTTAAPAAPMDAAMPTDVPLSEGVGPEIGEVPPPAAQPAVVSTEPFSAPNSTAFGAPQTKSPMSTFDTSDTQVTAPVFAPLDSMTKDSMTKKKRKRKKKCKCPTRKNKKLPKCKRGSQRSKKTNKCKSKKKCGKGTRRDPATGVCQPK